MNTFLMESAINPSGDTDVMLAVFLSLIVLCLENAAYTKCYRMTMSWLRKKTGGAKGMITYPPNKTQMAVSMIWGLIFVLAGLLVILPIFGGFGLLWTLVAAVFTGLHAYQIFTKKYAGAKLRTGGGRRSVQKTPFMAQPRAPSPAQGAKHRLEQLDTLRSAGLIDDREYRQKRQEILRKL